MQLLLPALVIRVLGQAASCCGVPIRRCVLPPEVFIAEEIVPLLGVEAADTVKVQLVKRTLKGDVGGLHEQPVSIKCGVPSGGVG